MLVSWRRSRYCCCCCCCLCGVGGIGFFKKNKKKLKTIAGKGGIAGVTLRLRSWFVDKILSRSRSQLNAFARRFFEYLSLAVQDLVRCAKHFASQQPTMDGTEHLLEQMQKMVLDLQRHSAILSERCGGVTRYARSIHSFAL